MKYDLNNQHRRGPCDNCKMRGILFRKAFVQPMTSFELPAESDLSAELPILDLCITCFETPQGIVSDNLKHQRLPEDEYRGRTA